MKIAQIIGEFGNGGAQRLAYNLGLALKKEGMDCIGISIRKKGSYAFQNKNFEIIDLKAENTKLKSYLKAIFKLRKILKKRDLDVLHIHGTQMTLPVCAFASIKLKNMPKLVFTWHDSGSILKKKGFLNRIRKWSMKRCDLIFTSSNEIMEKFKKEKEFSEICKKMKVFKNGVPIIKEKNKQTNNILSILWMARFSPIKDPLILIKATSKLYKEGFDFKIKFAGNTPDREWLVNDIKKLAKKEGIEKKIEFLGWIDDTAKLIRNVDIAVQTSHHEGLSMSLLEQMMAGLAIIATDVGDTSVAIENNKTGLLIKPKNKEQLTNALRTLIKDKNLRKKLGTCARKKAIEEFSLKKMAKKAVKEYNKLFD